MILNYYTTVIAVIHIVFLNNYHKIYNIHLYQFSLIIDVQMLYISCMFYHLMVMSIHHFYSFVYL